MDWKGKQTKKTSAILCVVGLLWKQNLKIFDWKEVTIVLLRWLLCTQTAQLLMIRQSPLYFPCQSLHRGPLISFWTPDDLTPKPMSFLPALQPKSSFWFTTALLPEPAELLQTLPLQLPYAAPTHERTEQGAANLQQICSVPGHPDPKPRTGLRPQREQEGVLLFPENII